MHGASQRTESTILAKSEKVSLLVKLHFSSTEDTKKLKQSFLGFQLIPNILIFVSSPIFIELELSLDLSGMHSSIIGPFDTYFLNTKPPFSII